MSEETGDNDVVNYGFSYALDRDGFFRRACPSCGREHKVKASADELAYVLDPAFRELGLDLVAAREGTDGDSSTTEVFCPYCGHRSPLSETTTDELQRYVNNWVTREVIVPRLRDFASGLESSIGRRQGRSGGLFSIGVSFNADIPPLPPRPIAGPEPPDMKRVFLLCCRQEIKVLDRWYDGIVCPHCGVVAVLQ